MTFRILAFSRTYSIGLVLLAACVLSIILRPDPRRYVLEHVRQQSHESAMSPADSEIYGRLAEEMTVYHSILRDQWDKLYASTEPEFPILDISSFIVSALHFCASLKGHHDIEEAEWFPQLGRKMKVFQPGNFATVQHQQMHNKLDVLAEYLRACRAGDRDLSQSVVRGIMDDLGDVLWAHMNDEVRELGAENMMRHWTREEMMALLEDNT